MCHMTFNMLWLENCRNACLVFEIEVLGRHHASPPF